MADDKLPPEDEARYSAIIDNILQNADLNTISAKAIRKGLQAKVDQDLSAQKKLITDLIMSRFDKFTEAAAAPPVPKPPEPTPIAPVKTETNGIDKSKPKPSNGVAKKRTTPSDSGSLSDAAEDESQLSSLESSPPPKKKQKAARSTEDSDAAFAARLQAEENRAGRATRGAATGKRKAAPTKKVKKEKKKSKARVGSAEDSDVEGADKKEVKRNGGFHKPMTLSPALSALLDGETTMSRPQTVKKIWAYIKGNNLQDPSDGRIILCDDALRAVFKTDKVHMFTMNKLLGPNLYAAEEIAGA